MIFRKTNLFLALTLISVSATAVVQILYRQGVISLWINKHNAALADVFFKYVTHLGDGVFCAALGGGLFLLNEKSV